jgi:hypothetical protein
MAPSGPLSERLDSMGFPKRVRPDWFGSQYAPPDSSAVSDGSDAVKEVQLGSVTAKGKGPAQYGPVQGVRREQRVGKTQTSEPNRTQPQGTPLNREQPRLSAGASNLTEEQAQTLADNGVHYMNARAHFLSFLRCRGYVIGLFYPFFGSGAV